MSALPSLHLPLATTADTVEVRGALSLAHAHWENSDGQGAVAWVLEAAERARSQNPHRALALFEAGQQLLSMLHDATRKSSGVVSRGSTLPPASRVDVPRPPPLPQEDEGGSCEPGIEPSELPLFLSQRAERPRLLSKIASSSEPNLLEETLEDEVLWPEDDEPTTVRPSLRLSSLHLDVEAAGCLPDDLSLTSARVGVWLDPERNGLVCMPLDLDSPAPSGVPTAMLVTTTGRDARLLADLLRRLEVPSED
ncbi:MAG: hypothetical protein AAGA56_08600 [Myxococcota bacterium]